MVFADKDHPRCIGVTSAEPQNTDFRPSHLSHILAPLVHNRKNLPNFPTNLIPDRRLSEYSARFFNFFNLFIYGRANFPEKDKQVCK
jgi:hypothetical protein